MSTIIEQNTNVFRLSGINSIRFERLGLYFILLSIIYYVHLRTRVGLLTLYFIRIFI